jgi:hypothetical protein
VIEDYGMITIYRLQLDKRYITEVQEATESTENFGIEPTHGIFGSPEWWQHIRKSTLPVHHLKGTVCSVHMESMNDWPEFTLRTDAGKEFTWSRYANRPEFATLYTVGRPIEIDYVIQRHRATSVGPGSQLRIPIEIRVDETFKSDTGRPIQQSINSGSDA